MYGVPEDLDLSFFHGAELVQVCLSLHQVQFHFHPDVSIHVQGGWELIDAAGGRIDHGHDRPERPPYRIHWLLGRRVVGTEVSPPGRISLRFEGGEALRIFDDSREYESFQIQPGDIVV